MHDDVMAHVSQTVREHVVFPTVDQLQDAVARLAAERAACRLRQIGNSRLGEPLTLLSIGDGPRNAVIIAGVHPNEPVGFHTVLALASLVSDTRELADGWTWHFAVSDPDAARGRVPGAGETRADIAPR